MKFVVMKKKYILLAILAVISMVWLSLDYQGGASASVFFGVAPRLVPIYSVDTDEKKVAISFDTAWGADKTENIVKTLKEYNVGATFFMVGFWVEKYPEMVKLIDDNGIEIGTHSNTHPDFVKLSDEQMKLELTTSIDLINNITGKSVDLFRAPYGSYNNSMLNLTESMGLKTIQWDVDTLDWKGLSGLEICERVMSRVKNGSIILCHNNSEHILDALPLLLERLKNAGYEVVSVGDLIFHENYYIDNLGIQRKQEG
ncbi:MAG: polysaccharide deacetylase family protein [Clostridia bacterium]|nr:polysaccharide deacetylase family protein [Clostridia bacterium]